MSTLLMTAILFAFAGCASLAMRKRLEEQLPLAAGTVILVLYGFSLFGQLHAGMWTVLALAAAALAILPVMLIARRKDRPLRQLVTPGCAFFFLIALWLLVSFRGYMFSAWDDFSHWGLAVKNMSIYSALPSGVPQATVTYTDYPPATTLFSWLWCSLSGGFNEGDVQRALNMLILCFMMPAMKEQRWRKPGKALCMSALLFMLPMVFGVRFYQTYRTLQVDALLGCMMLYALYSWFTAPHDAALYLSVGCTLALLTLVKGSGAFLAGILVAVIAADEWKCSGRRFVKKLTAVFCFAAAVLLARLTWECYLSAHGAAQVWDSGRVTLSAIADLLLGRAHPDKYRIIRHFVQELCAMELWGSGHLVQMSFISWIVVLVIAQRLLLHRMRQEKGRYSLTFFILWTGLVIWLAVLLLTYLYMFRLDEAMVMNSLDRYLSSYMLPLAGLTILMAVRRMDAWLESFGLSAPLCVMACLLMVVHPQMLAEHTLGMKEYNTDVYEQRMLQLVPQWIQDRLNSETDRVYYVAAEDNGALYYRGAYQLTPVHIQDGMWSTWPVAEKQEGAAELPAVQYSVQEWSDVLKNGGFTYVYLAVVNDRFVNDYAPLFESGEAIQEGMLYQVSAAEEDVRLIAVQ